MQPEIKILKGFNGNKDFPEVIIVHKQAKFWRPRRLIAYSLRTITQIDGLFSLVGFKALRGGYESGDGLKVFSAAKRARCRKL